MIRNNNISCIFNSDADLLLSQEHTLNIWVETCQDVDMGIFRIPYLIYHPNNSDTYINIYPFFERLLNTEDRIPRIQGFTPRYSDCDIIVLKDALPRTLSFLFSKQGLIGLQSGTERNPFSYSHPTVWINPPKDDVTAKMKKAILSL